MARPSDWHNRESYDKLTAMINFLATTIIFLYAAMAGFMAVRAWRGESFASVKKPLFLVGGITLLLHAVLNAQIIIVPEGLNLGFFQVASTAAWFIALLGLGSSVKAPIENLLVPVYAIAALAVLSLALSPGSHRPATALAMGLGSHIIVSILAYSVFTIALCQALALGIQNHELKARHLGGLINALPPLQTMEQLLFKMLWIGITLLTMSIASGIIFLDDIFAQSQAHKTVFAIIAWIMFAVLLWGRYQLGWRGQIAIRWTIGGFVALMLAYFGSEFVLQIVLGR